MVEVPWTAQLLGACGVRLGSLANWYWSYSVLRIFTVRGLACHATLVNSHDGFSSSRYVFATDSYHRVLRIRSWTLIMRTGP